VKVALALLALVGCGGAVAPSPASSPEPTDDEPTDVAGHEGDDPEAYPVAGEAGARTLLDEAWRELALVRVTRYSHRTHVDEATGTFEVDCSGFLDYALARAVPDAFEELREASVRRPLAKHYVQFFESLARGQPSRRWQHVARVTELVPGDVIAWLKPADSRSRNTGHVMIVSGPVRRDAVRADLVAVPIIDSTAITHGQSDSRKAARRTGLGTGEVLLIVDATDAPIGFRWSRGTRARERHTTVAMARIR
jgi:hypothetical protein